jgi:hypothetical protein
MPVEAAGRDLEVLTMSLNSFKKPLHHCEEEGDIADDEGEEGGEEEGEEEGEAEGDSSAGLPTAATVENDWEDAV